MNEIHKKIEESRKILITSHTNPDGDAVGSGLALLLGLEKKYSNKRIDFILQDNIPRNMRFLESVKKIKNINDVWETNYDLVIFVDSAAVERVGRVEKLTRNGFIINIDHHISNSKYGDINIVEDISSTSEIMYGVLKKLNIEMSLEMGEAIYLGLVNDTGNFSHSNVTSKTLLIASELVKLGVDNNRIVVNFLKTKSLSRMRVLGKALSDMVFIEDKKLMYFFISPFELAELDATKEDTEGVVEELLNYADCEISLFMREENGRVKGSLRSKYDVDVNKIAQMFRGGGHIKAAGFMTEYSKEEIIKKVVEKL